jgi:acyl carrier protein
VTAPAADPPVPEVYGEIVTLLQEAIGEDDDWRAAVGPPTRLDSDLFLDSIELAAFGRRLQQRFGAGIDLLSFVASLDIDQIIALDLAEVARYVADHRHDRLP